MKNSLRYRLIIAFLTIGIIPYAIYYIYTTYITQDKILTKLIQEQIREVDIIKATIEHELISVQNEALFLSSLAIMDDIAIDDIDKRVSNVLKQQYLNIQDDLLIFGINSKLKVVASSQDRSINRDFKPKEILINYNPNSKYTIYNNKIYFISKIDASFKKGLYLGFLVIEYPLSNLDKFNKNEFGVSSKIIDKNLKKSYEKRDKTLIITEPFNNILNGYSIIYTIDKAIALHFLYDFISFTIYLMPLAFIIILLIAILFAKSILKPIEELTVVSEEITKSKDYTLDVDIQSDDEIGRLSNSFNKMLKVTHGAHQELIEKIKLLESTKASSSAKSAFISNMSHELRTPLNSIIGSSQYIISYEKADEKIVDIVSNIESSSQYLLGMINEILDIAKIESGYMEVNITKVNFKNLIQESLSMMQLLIEDKNLKLNFSYDNSIKEIIEIDHTICTQIILNLLSNSIKFTKEGTINFDVRLIDNKIVITIEDTGIGISKENLSKLFKDFTQVENIMQSAHKGTGLGLSLSRKLAHLIGGDLSLQSDGEGHGVKSIFSFSS